jgi:uncharacterized protein YaiL (DUF2058 family)
MSDSLRDQLLGLGFKPAGKADKPERQGQGKVADQAARSARPDNPRSGGPSTAGSRPHPGRPSKAGARAGGKARSHDEIDLARAYAIRAQKEKDERIEAERQRQEQARGRREAKAKLAELLKGKALNDPDAEIARHFDYGGKIKRIYVNAEQLKSLNAGELGVVQIDGRYLLVTAAVLAEADAIFAPAIALKVDPNAPAEDDPYADPQYQVPDDLVW